MTIVVPTNHQNFAIQNPAPSGSTVSVGTSSVEVAFPNLTRPGIIFANPGSVTIWLCPSNQTAIAGQGVPILPGATLRFINSRLANYTCGWNAVAASGSANPLQVIDLGTNTTPLAPTPTLSLSNSSYTVGNVQGTLIGELSVINGVGSYNFSMTDTHGGAAQTCCNPVNEFVQVGVSPVSSAQTFNVVVHADNGAGGTVTQTLPITALPGALALLLSHSSYTIGAVQGDLIGQVTVINGVGTYTITLTDSHSGATQITENLGSYFLQLGPSPVLAPQIFNVTLHGDNGAGSTITHVFPITASPNPSSFEATPMLLTD